MLYDPTRMPRSRADVNAAPGPRPPRPRPPPDAARWGRYPGGVTFRPHVVGSAGVAATDGDGHIDYRLARAAVVDEYRRGRRARHDVCDAHPELVRAARNVGEPTRIECPICEDGAVVLVTYAFGSRLPPSGRCVTTRAELARLSARTALACYVVEVCPGCCWNHLARSFVVEQRTG